MLLKDYLTVLGEAFHVFRVEIVHRKLVDLLTLRVK